jgi:hypothetical protein
VLLRPSAVTLLSDYPRRFSRAPGEPAVVPSAIHPSCPHSLNLDNAERCTRRRRREDGLAGRVSLPSPTGADEEPMLQQRGWTWLRIRRARSTSPTPGRRLAPTVLPMVREGPYDALLPCTTRPDPRSEDPAPCGTIGSRARWRCRGCRRSPGPARWGRSVLVGAGSDRHRAWDRPGETWPAAPA